MKVKLTDALKYKLLPNHSNYGKHDPPTFRIPRGRNKQKTAKELAAKKG